MQRFAVAVLIAVLVVPAETHADGKKQAGGILTTAGGALMLSAFNYKGDQCPPGYTTHTSQGLPTQCVYISSSGSDVREATTAVTYKRPALMWTGVGAATAGIVLLLLPGRAANVVDVSVTPTGWLASKTFEFSKHHAR